MSEKSRWAKLAGLPKQETKQQLDENVVGSRSSKPNLPNYVSLQDYETGF